MALSDPPAKYSTKPQSIQDLPIFSDADYSPVLTNWFTAKPYGFRFSPKSGGAAQVMYLPLNPSNLTVTTNFATNLVPTIFGTVEEHSPIRYYDITIDGTTGIGPKYLTPSGVEAEIKPAPGRTAFSVQTNFSTQALGFFAKTLQTAQNVFTDVKSIFGAVAAPVSGLQLNQTGYYAFHNLYRFLLKYKKDWSDPTTSSNTTSPPIVFFNYKDNNEYAVVIKSFILRRDKDNPMLYNYNISMRGYDLTSVQSSDNNLGVNTNNTVNQLLVNLGLNGVKGSTFLSEAKNISSQVKGVLGSIANGTNQLGR